MAMTVLLTVCPAPAADGGGFQFGTLGQGIASLIIFVALLVVLGKWAWKPILSQLEAREKKISDTIEQAQRRQEEAQQLLAQYQARLAAAEEQAAALVAESRKEANVAREKILHRAAEEAQNTAKQLRIEIEAAKQEALREAYDAWPCWPPRSRAKSFAAICDRKTRNRSSRNRSRISDPRCQGRWNPRPKLDRTP